MSDAPNQSDRDLLIRIDEQVKALRVSFDSERLAVGTRQTKQDADIEKMRTEIDDLRTSRAQVYAIAATVSCFASWIIRMFVK